MHIADLAPHEGLVRFYDSADVAAIGKLKSQAQTAEQVRCVLLCNPSSREISSRENSDQDKLILQNRPWRSIALAARRET